MSFSIAIDFETADNKPDSACAVGMAKIDGTEVVDTFYTLIRPPRPNVFFTYIHGLTWPMLKDSPTFLQVWPAMSAFMEGATFMIAHNAPFDQRVLNACCVANKLPVPELPFVCTVKESRRLLRLPSHKLDAVCRHCGIILQHHHAGSDAQAAAEIWLYLQKMPRDA